MVLALGVLVSAAGLQEPGAVVAEATAAFEAGEYARAAGLFEAAIDAGAPAARCAYSAACCHARLGKPDEAFTWLGRSLDAGFRDVERLREDVDLASLHDDPRWGSIVERCEQNLANFNKSLKEPALREELLQRLERDQRIRLTLNPDFAEWARIDADNIAFMRGVIDQHGWPGRSLVGTDGANAAFFLVQHAAAGPAFQKRCLELLTKAVEQNKAPAVHMAYLTDRVLVLEGKPQRYGTQFAEVAGQLKPMPIEDEANVDARRRQVGLGPLAEHVRLMHEMKCP